MPKKYFWLLLLALSLTLTSIILYFVHYLLFKDIHHIFLYLIGDIAFLPVEVMLVSLIIERILNRREKEVRLDKLNMIIGTFFSELGNKLIELLSKHDTSITTVIPYLKINNSWDKKEFNNALNFIKNYKGKILIKHEEINSFKEELINKRDFMLRLLENQNLLEHESFTDLLMSIFHLIEELLIRDNIYNYSENDLSHLNLDINRVYSYIIKEWLNYNYYLKKNYSYLFSLAVRTNPFNEDACVFIK